MPFDKIKWFFLNIQKYSFQLEEFFDEVNEMQDNVVPPGETSSKNCVPRKKAKMKNEDLYHSGTHLYT